MHLLKSLIFLIFLSHRIFLEKREYKRDGRYIAYLIAPTISIVFPLKQYEMFDSYVDCYNCTYFVYFFHRKSHINVQQHVRSSASSAACRPPAQRRTSVPAHDDATEETRQRSSVAHVTPKTLRSGQEEDQ